MGSPLAVMLLSALLLLALGSCGQSSARHATASAPRTATPSPTAQPASRSAFVTFAAGIAYPSAMRIVTDLGLQPHTFCGEGVSYAPPGATEASVNWWAPEALPKAFIETQGPDIGRGRLYVLRTPLAPPDWATQLAEESSVVKVQDYTVDPSFPAPPTVNTAPPADAVQFVGEDQVDALAQVRFANPVSYEDAVVLTSQLGFRLSDPCYERAVTNGSKPTWQPMGQEANFATSHTLVVRVTYFNATSWRQQLTGSVGVQSIEAPATFTC